MTSTAAPSPASTRGQTFLGGLASSRAARYCSTISLTMASWASVSSGAASEVSGAASSTPSSQPTETEKIWLRAMSFSTSGTAPSDSHL